MPLRAFLDRIANIPSLTTWTRLEPRPRDGSLARSLQAFVIPDVELARQVCSDDDEVDAQRREFHEQILIEINRRPEQTECLLKLYSIAKHLERLADMATTIAEEVITMVEGDIIRHKH